MCNCTKDCSLAHPCNCGCHMNVEKKYNFYYDKTNQVKNNRGEYVPAIPLPYYGLKKKCECGETFWTEIRYEEHYALKHILGL